jgi:probable rRNA maturation factor
MNIVIANRQRTRKINSRLLKEIAEALLADLEIGEAELGVNLVAAREMILINETFLRHEGSTDVVTFDYSNAECGARNAELSLHGEIFVCVDEAVLQARQFKTAWQSEIVRYLVHGVLHLLGHDDRHTAARRRMKREENRRLAGLSKKFNLAQIGSASKLRA